MTKIARIALDLHEHQQTSGDQGAFLLSLNGDPLTARWVPKAHCDKIADGKFRIEPWKAEQEGLLNPPSHKQGRLDL